MAYNGIAGSCCFGDIKTAVLCTQNKNSGACASALECSTRACTGTQGMPTPHCEICQTQYGCPQTTPLCQLTVGVVGCLPCNTGFQTCNADGSLNCHTEICPANATDCGADNHCKCGALTNCPYAGQICVGGQCKLTGLWPCIIATDCAYGTCTNGACPPIPMGGFCPALLVGECVAGTTCMASTSGTPLKCL